MSGGFFDYVSLKDAGQILAEPDSIQKLRELLDHLNELGYSGTRAMKDLVRLIASLYEEVERQEKFKSFVDGKLEKLSGVTKATEWHASNDWGPDSVRKAVDEYTIADITW